MNVEERIRVSSILVEMKKYKETAKKLGLIDTSSLNKAPVNINVTKSYSMK